jgi:ketosteroid isomerase-like protein
MTDVVYAIRISDLEYTGLKIMDVKIGRSTDIDSRLSQYQTGNMNAELLDMWKPNPEKTLSTTERGVQAVAEKYAYDSQSEKYVFLQDGYQKFAETINKLLKNVSREDLDETDESVTEETETEDYTGKTPAVIKILGETYEVDNWRDCLITALRQVLTGVDDQHKVTEIRGTKREYFVEKGRQSDLVSPKRIPDTEFYVESNFSANDIIKIIERVLVKYDYEPSELEIFIEEDTE